MCTVTYIPSGNDIFLTANRDEQRDRPSAHLPEIYRMNGMGILFPKDALAGGTWFAINEKGNSMVFLNGALKNHTRLPPYRKSRGLILLDLVATDSPVTAFGRADLSRIEPFTTIITENGSLWVCAWNGSFKTADQQKAGLPHIWSSVTLYNRAAIDKRKQWFADWLSANPEPSSEDILRFHRNAGDGNPQNDLLMNRDNKLFTHSISSARISGNLATLHYEDIRNRRGADCSISFLKAIPVNA